MDSSSQGIVVMVVLAIAVTVRFFSDRLDRARIREHIARHGGKVLDISWNPFGSGWPATQNARLYEVCYAARGGAIVNATCATSMFSDVHWLRDAPPGFSQDERTSRLPHVPKVSREEIEHSLSVPAEPIPCLECGRRIPASVARCPHCGWSYQAQ